MEQQAPWVHSCFSATKLNKQHSGRVSLSLSHALLLTLSRRVLFYRCVVGTDDAEKQNPFVCGLFSCCCCCCSSSLRFGTELNFVNSFLTRSILCSLLPCSCLVSLFFFLSFMYVSLCVRVCVCCFLCYLCLNFIICLPSVGICRVH